MIQDQLHPVFITLAWPAPRPPAVKLSRSFSWFLRWVSLGGLGLVVGCHQPPSAKTSLGPPRVSVVEAIEREVREYHDFIGRTEASETVEVRSRVSGFIKTVEFRDGDRVTAGQRLFTIEPDAYEAIHEQSESRLALWRAKLDLANSKYRREKALLEARAVSQEEYDEAVSAVKEAEAAIVAAEADTRRTALDVKYTAVTSELDGLIDRAFVTPGNLVTGGLGSGTLLTRIVKNSPLYAYFDIDERSLVEFMRLHAAERVSSGARTPLRDLQMTCWLRVGDEDEFSQSGLLDFMENRVDSATGTIRVRAVFDNVDEVLTGGLFVRLRVMDPEPSRAILVPEQSLGIDQGVRFVYVVDDRKLPQRRTVQLGRQYGKWRVIRGDLKAGEQVVYRGLQRIRTGLPVDAEIEAGPAEERWEPSPPLPSTPVAPPSAAASSVNSTDKR
jgi:RND family efflux transporter MFP subunit